MKLKLAVLATVIMAAFASAGAASAVNDPGQESFGCGGHTEWQCVWYFGDNFWNLWCDEAWVRDC